MGKVDAAEAEQKAKELDAKSAQDVLKWAIDRYSPKIAMASSFGAEDVVLIDMISKISPKTKIFTLDTGRLHEETYEVMEKIREKYHPELIVCFPDAKSVEELEKAEGFYSFRKSIEARKKCCGIRKVEPLNRTLATLDAWITGLRREQAQTRTGVPKVEIDAAHGGMAKINPLADWSEKQVWDYIKANDVPYNALHDKNFPSIGCAPCTRAVKLGEDIRAGRWWWESPEHKECGLHVKK